KVRVMRSADTPKVPVHWRAGCLESVQVRFGGGRLETCVTVNSARRETPQGPARRWPSTLLGPPEGVEVAEASALSLDCKLDDGWCLFTVRAGDRTLRLQACGHRDSVRELAAAAKAVSEGNPVPDVWMCDEPSYSRWRLWAEAGRLRIVIEE